MLPGFSQLRDWEVVFVRWGSKAQDNKSFLKVTPLIWAIEGQNNESYRGKMHKKVQQESVVIACECCGQNFSKMWMRSRHKKGDSSCQKCEQQLCIQVFKHHKCHKKYKFSFDLFLYLLEILLII